MTPNNTSYRRNSKIQSINVGPASIGPILKNPTPNHSNRNSYLTLINKLESKVN